MILKHVKRARVAAENAQRYADATLAGTDARSIADHYAAEAAAYAQKAGLLVTHRSADMAKLLVPRYADRAERAALRAYKAADVVQAAREGSVVHR